MNDQKDLYIKYLETVIEEQKNHISSQYQKQTEHYFCEKCHKDLKVYYSKGESRRVFDAFVNGLGKGILFLILFFLVMALVIIFIF